MMKKISSWVFGSFFRTMGRFFFFLFFGFLVAMIIQKNDWSSIRWTDLLGIEMVKADTMYLDGYDTQWYYNNRSTRLPTNGPFQYNVQTSGTINSGFQVSEFYTKNDNPMPTQVIRGGEFIVPFYVQAPIINRQDNTIYNRCDQWRQNSAGGWYCYTISQSNDYENHYINPQLTVWAMAVYTSGYTDMCTVDLLNNKILCPVADIDATNSLWFIQVRTIVYYDEYTQTGYSYYVGLGDKTNRYKNVSQAIIDNQNQNTNQTISTITDSNTTEASSEANNFFSGFTSQDNGGISSIITAPLQAISGLVSAQCVQIELPIPYLDNKTLILPCMSSIYREHFGAVFSLYQTIIFGAIAYRMLVSLFMMIQGFKNPDDDKIEVVDL